MQDLDIFAVILGDMPDRELETFHPWPDELPNFPAEVAAAIGKRAGETVASGQWREIYEKVLSEAGVTNLEAYLDVNPFG